MGAAMQALDLQRRQAPVDHVVQAAWGERTKWRIQSEKDLSMGATGPDLLQISNYGVPNAREQRIFLSATLFGTQNRNGLAFPVDLV
jgi:hypothetical protein